MILKFCSLSDNNSWLNLWTYQKNFNLNTSLSSLPWFDLSTQKITLSVTLPSSRPSSSQNRCSGLTGAIATARGKSHGGCRLTLFWGNRMLMFWLFVSGLRGDDVHHLKYMQIYWNNDMYEPHAVYANKYRLVQYALILVNLVDSEKKLQFEDPGPSHSTSLSHYYCMKVCFNA